MFKKLDLHVYFSQKMSAYRRYLYVERLKLDICVSDGDK